MKVWLCYMNAGGGHKAPAQALARAMQKLRGDGVQTEMINLADKASIFLRFLMEDGYVWLIHSAPWLYAVVYELSLTRPIIALEHKLGVIFLKRGLRRRIAAEKPDLIVSTYFLVEGISEALRDLGLTIPLQVVVTEPYSVPPTWFYTKSIPYIVFSERARALAVEQQVHNVKLFSPIVNNELVKPLTNDDKVALRKKLGLDPEKKIVLLIGGGAGLPGGEKIMRELVKSDLNAQYVFVCGSNKRFENSVHKICANSSQKVTLFGFINFVPELIALADIVVTKAGGGVTSEIMAQHKPLLITHYIYGQEKGTMEHVVQGGFGWYEPNPKRAAKKLKQFFAEAAVREGVIAKYGAQPIEPGNMVIAEHLLKSVASHT